MLPIVVLELGTSTLNGIHNIIPFRHAFMRTLLNKQNARGDRRCERGSRVRVFLVPFLLACRVSHSKLAIPPRSSPHFSLAFFPASLARQTHHPLCVPDPRTGAPQLSRMFLTRFANELSTSQNRVGLHRTRNRVCTGRGVDVVA